ncbi:MAG: hypothetical protein ACXWKP_15015 [Bradyrhizobium sp.]
MSAASDNTIMKGTRSWSRQALLNDGRRAAIALLIRSDTGYFEILQVDTHQGEKSP